MPHMKLRELTAVDYSKPSLRLIAGFAAQIAFLDQPKRALRILRNERLLHAYQDAVHREAKGARHSSMLLLRLASFLMMQSGLQAAISPFSKPARECCRYCARRLRRAASSVRHVCASSLSKLLTGTSVQRTSAVTCSLAWHNKLSTPMRECPAQRMW